jgi:hypothetical protein
MRLAHLMLPALLFAGPALAQEQDPELERPADWNVRFDQPADESDLYFVSMPPGWHVTSGPASILYNTSQVASGEYKLESKIYLFPGQRREGFGVLFGGQELDGPGQKYVYFLIRGDGSYLVKLRVGSETQVIIPWTKHEAIVEHEGQEGTAENVLAVRCGSEMIDLFVNGEKVNSIPRSDVEPDGIVGLRVNHGLNLHVADLTVTSGDD